MQKIRIAHEVQLKTDAKPYFIFGITKILFRLCAMIRHHVASAAHMVSRLAFRYTPRHGGWNAT
jgi:hypothetical protein